MRTRIRPLFLRRLVRLKRWTNNRDKTIRSALLARASKRNIRNDPITDKIKLQISESSFLLSDPRRARNRARARLTTISIYYP